MKVNYTGKDVKVLTGGNLGKTQITKIMNKCRDEHAGCVIGRPYVISAKSYWEYEGTTLEEQLRLLGIAKQSYV